MMQEQRAEDDIPLAIDFIGEHLSLFESCDSPLLPRKFGGRFHRRPALIPAFYLAGDASTIQLLPNLDGNIATATGKVQQSQGAIDRMPQCPSYDRIGQGCCRLTEVVDPAKASQCLVMQLGCDLGIVHPFWT
jgi:hypothetical protein